MKHCIVFFLIIAGFFCQRTHGSATPRVFIFTDINIEAGDPDDRQSLIHLLWYADELEIVGIVPDRVSARGVEACTLAIEAYAKDYEAFDFKSRGYPEPQELCKILVWEREAVIRQFRKHASSLNDPLYILIWGNMNQFGDVIRECIDLKSNIRVLTIGSGLMLDKDRQYVKKENLLPPAEQMNWNSPGRNQIYSDPRFDDLWWIEINWTYNGMFSGNAPRQMFTKLLTYGSMGQHMEEVTRNNDWARYFRVGDTPSVLYLIDPAHDPDDPTRSSWAGAFRRALPAERPNYFTDDCGPVEWDYSDPARTWHNHEAVFQYSKATLERERPAMYAALLEKLGSLYQVR